MAVINFPILYINDPLKGRPLFNGQIFVGIPDLDPEDGNGNPINSKQLNVVEEDGTVVPVDQPFELSAGGNPVYNGNPVRLDVDGNYSIKILDKLGVQKYYIENVFEGQPVTETEMNAAIDAAVVSFEFDTVDNAKISVDITGETVTLKALDVIRIKERANGVFDVISGTGTATGGRIIAHNSLDISFVLRTSFRLNVKQFGAKGDKTTDDSARIQEAIDYYKTLVKNGAWIGNGPTFNPHNEHGVELYFPFGIYKTLSSLWFGLDDDAGEDYDDGCKNIVADFGAVINSHAAGKLAMDFSGVQNVRMIGLTLFGDKTNAPAAGFFLARSGNNMPNPSAGNHRFTDVAVLGNYTVASVYNYASEINTWSNCNIKNSKAASACSFIQTSNNAKFALSSEFTTTAVTEQSNYGDRFVNTDILYDVDGVGDNAAVICESVSFGPKFSQCYFDLLQGGSTKTPIMILRDAQGEVGTSARNIGLSVNDCQVETQFDSIIQIENNVRSLKVKGNNFSGAATTADIVITSTGQLRDFDIQTFKGSTDIMQMEYSIDPAATVEKEELTFYKIDVISGWDFNSATNLTLDGVFNEIDLNSTHGIPKNAKYVMVKVLAEIEANIGNGNKFNLREPSVTTLAQYFEIAPQVVSLDVVAEGRVPMSDGKIEYMGSTDYADANGGKARILILGYFI